MKTNKILIATAAASLLALAFTSAPHETDCPYCDLKVVQNTDQTDNEVVVKYGNKKIEYRCIYCVIKDEERFSGDIVVYSPSEKKGEPVVLKRSAGNWTAPAGSVFLNTFKKHEHCAALSRSFKSRAGYDDYVRAHKVQDAKPLTLTQFLAEVAK